LTNNTLFYKNIYTFIKGGLKISTSSSEMVYQRFLEYLMSGSIRSGEKINEEKLTKEFGISRTPLREAIRRLQSEGLIEAEPQKGATVKQLSMAEVDEIYTIRARLESLAVELTVSNMDEAAKKKLLSFKKKFKQSLEKKQNLKWLNDNIDFHFFFAEMSKNGTLYQMIQNINIRVHKYKHIALVNPAFIKLYDTQHEEIIHNAVVVKNPKKAGKAMHDHIEAVKKNLLKHLSDFPFYL
jgi:DNA-binding GntR family transcriptional regulator